MCAQMAPGSLRLLPSSFDPNDPNLSAVARPGAWRWQSAERVFRRHGVRGVMSRLPLFWQAETPLWQAARAAGGFIFLNDAKNMAVGRMAILHGEIGAVVTDGADAVSFARYLAENDTPAGLVWIIIHPPGTIHPLPTALAQPGISVYQEVHRTPCVPIFEQCDALADAKQTAFHLAEEPEPGVPVPFAARGTCACGKIMYAPL